MNSVNEPEKRRTYTGVVNGIALGLVVIITAYAAFLSQLASNKVQESQNQRDEENRCTSTIIFSTVKALNERTEFSTAQAEANVRLQKSQLEFITTLVNPQVQANYKEKLEGYFKALKAFNEVVAQNAGKAESFPYPVPEQYARCLANASR